MRIGIVVSSKYGQTEKIARYMREEFRATGHLAQVWVIEKSERAPFLLSEIDAIVIGCPVYVGSFAYPLLRWTRKNIELLNSLPSSFFTVSQNAADARPRARNDDDRLLRLFLAQTGLKPLFVASFAGALKYRKYGFLTRILLRRISSSAGGPTDTTRDHELTSWGEVRAFADAFSAMDRSSHFAMANRIPDLATDLDADSEPRAAQPLEPQLD